MPGTLQVRWEPGSDILLGTCHCGASRTCQDPVEAWSWLLAHPDGHDGHDGDDGYGAEGEPR